MSRGRTQARRRRGSAKSSRGQHPQSEVAPASMKRPTGGRQGLRNLWTSALVAIGCWGFAITFVFMTNDENRYLFGGMAAVLALMWSVNFVVRLRKWQQRG